MENVRGVVLEGRPPWAQERTSHSKLLTEPEGETNRPAVGEAASRLWPWTLRLLADQLVELRSWNRSVPKGRQTLKNGMTKRKIEYWVILDANGEFVAHMEEVLGPTKKPRSRLPSGVHGRAAVQLIGETECRCDKEHP